MNTAEFQTLKVGETVTHSNGKTYRVYSCGPKTLTRLDGSREVIGPFNAKFVELKDGKNFGPIRRLNSESLTRG